MYREEEAVENEMPNATSSPEGELRFVYADYVSIGGRLDEESYSQVMKKAEQESMSGITGNFARAQTATIANVSGISLEAIHQEAGLDPVSIYEILRSDKIPAGVSDHHSQMNDQQLLVESLRMLGQQDAVNAIIATHPHIIFY